ncbi:hypothetical protein [Streptomyces sp. ME19-01-6]|uniref:hypothetical protein n=1 Tax=Streptomyces sp. ME19-01-6 TaxID=3028686 RepID=UPI0029ADC238|nr:hypothetical protein [Streptomyces sp. ME19-01-6]MDX3231520.1 hypothetical protein [Streptomyces sp. ME19-01-6]
MYSFYVFEGSFHQGGGGWEDIEVSHSLPAIQEAAVDYIRLGNWAGATDDFLVRAYQAGQLAVEKDLYPFLQVKVPGLTTISFRNDGKPQGGEPEPGSEYEEERSDYEADEWIEFFLTNVFQSVAEEEADEIEVTIDWARLALPELSQPLLPDEKVVFVRQVEGNERAWGEALAVDGDIDPDDDLEEQFGYGRHLTCGYNSLFL